MWLLRTAGGGGRERDGGDISRACSLRAPFVRSRHRLVNGTKKMLLRVILSNTKFPFYCLLRTAATSMAQQPLCSAVLRLLYPLPPSSATFQRLVPTKSATTDPLPPSPSLSSTPSPPRCRSLHFDQSDAIQLITFSTECLSRRRRRRREPLRCPSSGTQRAPGTRATRATRRPCGAARRSFRPSVGPPLLPP